MKYILFMLRPMSPMETLYGTRYGYTELGEVPNTELRRRRELVCRYDAALFWQVRDLPGTALNGQRDSGRGCSVCSSAARTLVGLGS